MFAPGSQERVEVGPRKSNGCFDIHWAVKDWRPDLAGPRGLRFDGHQYRRLKPDLSDYEPKRGIMAVQVPTDPAKAVDLIWKSHVTKCGDSYFSAQYDARDVFQQMHEYKGVSFKLQTDAVTGADRVNGIQWKGRAWLVSSSRRYYTPHGPTSGEWSQWVSSGGFGATVGDILQGADQFSVFKKNGQWVTGSNNLVRFRSIDCATVPR